MHKLQAQELLYDPMPRPDVKMAPLSEPNSSLGDARKLTEPDKTQDVQDMLRNLSFK